MELDPSWQLVTQACSLNAFEINTVKLISVN